MTNKKISSGSNLRQKDFFLLLFVAFLGLAAILSYYKLDQNIYNMLCQKPNRWGDIYWVDTFTNLGKAWLLICLALVWFLFKKRQKPVLIILLALILTALAVQALKLSTRRARPHEIRRACSFSGLSCIVSFR
ncbi:MAG: hypothetical protein ACYTFK_12505 [Planctomycetota bacterium]|jgi:cytochrome bd-type quinol oxidase subunit 2